MANEIEGITSRIRESLQQNEGASLAGILRDVGISPENQERVKGLLGGLGYSDAQLFDPVELTKIAHSFLSSMPEEARRRLLGVVLQAVADMSLGGVPVEIRDALSSRPGEGSASVSPGES
ncbi:MAG: hypothetical protein H5T95_03535 [Firmicutes bacterium]|nr:hypothetical protein [Bacillota bacterium]